MVWDGDRGAVKGHWPSLCVAVLWEELPGCLARQEGLQWLGGDTGEGAEQKEPELCLEFPQSSEEL